MPEEDSSMARITVRVPIEQRDHIYRLAEQMGVRTGHFASVALGIGARVLGAQMRQAQLVGVMTCDSCNLPLSKWQSPLFTDKQGNDVYLCSECEHGDDADIRIMDLYKKRLDK